MARKSSFVGRSDLANMLKNNGFRNITASLRLEHVCTFKRQYKTSRVGI